MKRRERADEVQREKKNPEIEVEALNEDSQ